MYLPHHFAETDREQIRSLVEQNPLCTLVVATDSEMIANHLPMFWVDDKTLIGHIALANPLHKLTSSERKCLAIFQGTDGYISPNWYPSKRVHHRHVPTWNYQVVHLHGELSFHFDQTKKASIVGRLTQHHELQLNGESVWRMSDAPPDYIQTMLENIVGVSVLIERVEAKSKLSQNRDKADFDGVVSALEQTGQTPMATAIRGKLLQVP